MSPKNHSAAIWSQPVYMRMLCKQWALAFSGIRKVTLKYCLLEKACKLNEAFWKRVMFGFVSRLGFVFPLFFPFSQWHHLSQTLLAAFRAYLFACNSERAPTGSWGPPWTSGLPSSVDLVQSQYGCFSPPRCLCEMAVTSMYLVPMSNTMGQWPSDTLSFQEKKKKEKKKEVSVEC